MKTKWLVSSLIVFVVGFLFSTSLIGIVIGLPLMIISIVMLTIGIIVGDAPVKKKESKKPKKKK